MSGQQLCPEDWKAKAAECSKTWRSMSEAEKDTFVAAAAEEQGQRDDLACQPWPSKCSVRQDMPTAPAISLPRSAHKAVSRQRCMASHRNFKDSDWWQELGCGVSCADGILRLDDIDLDSSKEDLFAKFYEFAKPASEMPESWSWAESVNVHHTTCLSGQCVASPSASLASKYVWSMSNLVQNSVLTIG